MPDAITRRAYLLAHKRVRRLRGPARYCMICGRFDRSRGYDWANLTGRYADPDDYWPLCRPCHRVFDMDAEKRALCRAMGEKGRQSRGARARLRTHCQNGHLLTPETSHPRSYAGGRRCRVCQRASQRRWRLKGRAS